MIVKYTERQPKMCSVESLQPGEFFSLEVRGAVFMFSHDYTSISMQSGQKLVLDTDCEVYP